ncbi:MAG: alanine dehydrogenase [Acidimicrobiales bacterium]
MKIGVPKEVKSQEYRVSCTPAWVHELAREGHQVLVESGAGIGSSISDDDFQGAGARIVPGADEVWGDADLIVKVKEPVPEEYGRLRKNLMLFAYLHLAASAECTDALLQAGTTAIAYETVELADRSLPLLAPMSEVAGRMAPQAGAHHLQRCNGGRGVLMGGGAGVRPAQVVVIGAGVAGMNAAVTALGMQAEVTLFDRNVVKLREANRLYRGHLRTLTSNAYELAAAVVEADLVIGAVLVPGARAPKLVTDEMVATMKQGSVLVDIAIDQGGCFESSRPTTHADPVFPVAESIFYCVANMPGAVPHTSTYALTNVTMPYALEIARLGWRRAMREDAGLAAGFTTHEGVLTHREVAQAHGLGWEAPATILAA